MKREAYIAGLRAMADFYEQHPEVKIYEVWLDKPEVVEKNFCYHDAGELRDLIRSIGSVQKIYDDRTLTIRKEIAPGFHIAFEIARYKVCKQVKKIIPAHTVEVPEKEVEEWECDPILAEEVA